MATLSNPTFQVDALTDSEIFPELPLPLDSIALEDSIVSEDFLASENFLASGDSLVSEDFLASENNFTSEYFLASQEIDIDPLTGMVKNPTVNASDVAALAPSGRRTLTVKSIECIKAGADPFGDDDIYITIGKQKIWGIHGMNDGDIRRVDTSVRYRGGATTINVWDSDPGPFDKDDFIGTIPVNGFYNGPAKVVTGSGSKYLVSFAST
jgi:hypothetical protein